MLSWGLLSWCCAVLDVDAVHNMISSPAVKEGGNEIIVCMNRIVHFLAFYHLVGMGQLCGS